SAPFMRELKRDYVADANIPESAQVSSAVSAATASDYILPKLKYPERFCISFLAITIAFLEHIHEGYAGLTQAGAVPLRNEMIGPVVDDLVRQGYGRLVLSL